MIILRYAGLILSLLYLPSSRAEWHGDIKLLSDYVYRGYSKSRGDPAMQGRIDYLSDTNWYAGLSVAQISFDDHLNIDRAEIEIRPYIGSVLQLLPDWRAEFSVSGYLYDNKIFNHDANYAELYVSLHYQDWLSGRVSIAPNAYQRQANVANYELNYRRDLLDNVQLSAGLGYNQAHALLGQNYFYWNIGSSWFVTSYLAIDIRYVDTALKPHHTEIHQEDFYPRQQDNQYLFSITMGF